MACVENRELKEWLLTHIEPIGGRTMKLYIEVLDNGYRMNITSVEPSVNREGHPIEVERKQKLVFENKEALMAKVQEALA